MKDLVLNEINEAIHELNEEGIKCTFNNEIIINNIII